MKKTIALIFMSILVGVAMAAGVANDSIGTVGQFAADKFIKYPTATSIIVGVITFLGWLWAVGQPLLLSFLKNQKTTWYWNETTQGWILKGLNKYLVKWFGTSFAHYNSVYDASEVGVNAANKAKIEALKKHFLKHDPVLSIDVK